MTTTLLDRSSLDVADLLSLIRDIGDRLIDIEDQLDRIDDQVDDVKDQGEEIDRQLGDLGERLDGIEEIAAAGTRYQLGVHHAVTAVLADLTARSSLIPADPDDEHYTDDCTGCLLTKNGYPQLAALLTGAGRDDDEDS